MKWTLEKAKQAALEFNSRNDFRNKYYSAWFLLNQNNLLDNACLHMKVLRKKWTKEECMLIASKYDKLLDFRKYHRKIYFYIWKNKWNEEIFSHMDKITHNWSKEECQEIALNYEIKSDFILNYRKIYMYALRHNWLDEICSHMKILGNIKKRLIYKYTFSDNSVYIGLTCNPLKRKKQHFNDTKSKVYIHYMKTGNTPIYEELTNYVDVNDAKILEIKYINEYKDKGFNILNISRGGDVGGNNIIWTYEKCEELISMCETKAEFRKKFKNAYYSSIRLGWYKELTKDIKNLRKPNGFWYDYNNCKEEASKFKTRNIFKLNSNRAYLSSSKNKWLDEFFPKKDN